MENINTMRVSGIGGLYYIRMEFGAYDFKQSINAQTQRVRLKNILTKEILFRKIISL